MERRVPGDLGWRLDDGDRRPPDDVDGDHRPPHDAGGFLRILSVTPFLVLGVVAVIALFSWALLFVFGFGEQETLWAWASGRPAGEVLTGLVVVLGLGLACVAVLVLAIWAALYGFRRGRVVPLLAGLARTGRRGPLSRSSSSRRWRQRALPRACGPPRWS